ncbi:hypothetical protein HZB03_04800 [Candidatus Woesearchaeota archaeon]|nr:hypothetical protein [Candidatus Woesearchaeota archaeon]
MVYNVGISSGWWKVGKDPGLLGMAQKIAGFSATQGIQFTQVDLETTSEFYEPELEARMRRVRSKLGIKAGLHGEIGRFMSLDSSLRTDWEQTHLRLCETLKFAAKFGLIYVNVHLSANELISMIESQQRVYGYSYPVVAPDGRPFTLWIKDKGKETKKELEKHISDRLSGRGDILPEAMKEKRKEDMKTAGYIQEETIKRTNAEIIALAKQSFFLRPADEQAIKEKHQQELERQAKKEGKLKEHIDEEELVERWLNLGPSDFNSYVLDDAEFGAYHIVAAEMKANNDYLWTNIVNSGDSVDDVYYNNEGKFAAAVAAKYLEGHIFAKHRYNTIHLEGMSIAEWLVRKNIHLLLETPEGPEGKEGLYRLFDPLHAYYAVKNMNCPNVRLTLDFEHMLSHKIDPDVKIKQLPGDFGRYVYLFHLGTPIPYFGTAHIPIARGSRSQEILYRWIYAIKKKGFDSGYIIFERGGGRSGGGKTSQEVMEDSVLALRQIAKYLDKDVPPEQLPLEFYGVSEMNEDVYKRQLVAIRDHAWDPLKGVLQIPEEEHTFLSGAAVKANKAEEWKKGKFR